MKVNMSKLRDLHAEAGSSGWPSKEFMAFANEIFDQWPAIYSRAKAQDCQIRALKDAVRTMPLEDVAPSGVTGLVFFWDSRLGYIPGHELYVSDGEQWIGEKTGRLATGPGIWLDVDTLGRVLPDPPVAPEPAPGVDRFLSSLAESGQSLADLLPEPTAEEDEAFEALSRSQEEASHG